MPDEDARQRETSQEKSTEAAKRAWIVHPFLFAVFPVLFLYAQNMKQFSPDVMLLPTLVLVVAASALWGLLVLLTRNARKAGLIVSLFLLLFFSFGYAYQVLPEYRLRLWKIYIMPATTVLIVWGVILLGGCWRMVKTKRRLDRLTKIINAAATVLVAISAFNIGIYELFSRETPEEDGGSDIQVTQGSESDPDIYYIIPDAYAREDVLRNLYGHDNRQFISYLESKGFYVADRSTANYMSTLLSLSSTLNLRYASDLLPDADPVSRDQLPLMRLLRNSEVQRFLKARGYTVVAFSVGYEPAEMPGVDIYLTPGWFGHEFQNALLDMTPVWLVFRSLARAQQHRSRLIYTFDRLERISDLPSPKLVFCHINAPHSPFVFDADGEPVDPQRLNAPGGPYLKDGKGDEYREFYAGQLDYINTRLKQAIDGILENSSRPPIIILQGDHGPRSLFLEMRWNAESCTERLGILNAYYLPGVNAEELLWKDITPINTFRVVLDAYFGTDHGVLEDERCFYSWGEFPYLRTDVTALVRPKPAREAAPERP